MRTTTKHWLAIGVLTLAALATGVVFGRLPPGLPAPGPAGRSPAPIAQAACRDLFPAYDALRQACLTSWALVIRWPPRAVPWGAGLEPDEVHAVCVARDEVAPLHRYLHCLWEQLPTMRSYRVVPS
jgi:hypothetical protein